MRTFYRRFTVRLSSRRSLFDEEYTTKRGEKTAENQDGDKWEGINGTCRAVTGTYLHGEIIIQETSTRSST